MLVMPIIKRLGLRKAHHVYLDAFARADRLDLWNKEKINTDLRMAHFLAMVLHETAGLSRIYENMNYSARRIVEVFGVNKHSAAVTPAEAVKLAKNPQALAERVYGLGNPKKAKDLGNTRPGDGWLFRGTGPLNITGGKNFRAVSKETGIDFYNNPDLAVGIQHILTPSFSFWSRNNLNALADQDDLAGITKKVNGGFNGFADRQAWFKKVWKAIRAKETSVLGNPTPSWEVSQPDKQTMQVQVYLNTLGADPELEVDGRLGPQTEVAIRKFQQANNLSVDGIAGPITLAALRMRVQTNPTTTESIKSTPKKPADHFNPGSTMIALGLVGEQLMSGLEGVKMYIPNTDAAAQLLGALALVGLMLLLLGKFAQAKRKQDELKPTVQEASS